MKPPCSKSAITLTLFFVFLSCFYPLQTTSLPIFHQTEHFFSTPPHNNIVAFSGFFPCLNDGCSTLNAIEISQESLLIPPFSLLSVSLTVGIGETNDLVDHNKPAYVFKPVNNHHLENLKIRFKTPIKSIVFQGSLVFKSNGLGPSPTTIRLNFKYNDPTSPVILNEKKYYFHLTTPTSSRATGLGGLYSNQQLEDLIPDQYRINHITEFFHNPENSTISQIKLTLIGPWSFLPLKKSSSCTVNGLIINDLSLSFMLPPETPIQIAPPDLPLPPISEEVDQSNDDSNANKSSNDDINPFANILTISLDKIDPLLLVKEFTHSTPISITCNQKVIFTHIIPLNDPLYPSSTLIPPYHGAFSVGYLVKDQITTTINKNESGGQYLSNYYPTWNHQFESFPYQTQNSQNLQNSQNSQNGAQNSPLTPTTKPLIQIDTNNQFDLFIVDAPPAVNITTNCLYLSNSLQIVHQISYNGEPPAAVSPGDKIVSSWQNVVLESYLINRVVYSPELITEPEKESVLFLDTTQTPFPIQDRYSTELDLTTVFPSIGNNGGVNQIQTNDRQNDNMFSPPSPTSNIIIPSNYTLILSSKASQTRQRWPPFTVSTVYLTNLPQLSNPYRNTTSPAFFPFVHVLQPLPSITKVSNGLQLTHHKKQFGFVISQFVFPQTDYLYQTLVFDIQFPRRSSLFFGNFTQCGLFHGKFRHPQGFDPGHNLHHEDIFESKFSHKNDQISMPEITWEKLTDVYMYPSNITTSTPSPPPPPPLPHSSPQYSDHSDPNTEAQAYDRLRFVLIPDRFVPPSSHDDIIPSPLSNSYDGNGSVIGRIPGITPQVDRSAQNTPVYNDTYIIPDNSMIKVICHNGRLTHHWASKPAVENIMIKITQLSSNSLNFTKLRNLEDHQTIFGIINNNMEFSGNVTVVKKEKFENNLENQKDFEKFDLKKENENTASDVVLISHRGQTISFYINSSDEDGDGNDKSWLAQWLVVIVVGSIILVLILIILLIIICLCCCCDERKPQPHPFSKIGKFSQYRQYQSTNNNNNNHESRRSGNYNNFDSFESNLNDSQPNQQQRAQYPPPNYPNIQQQQLRIAQKNNGGNNGNKKFNGQNDVQNHSPQNAQNSQNRTKNGKFFSTNYQSYQNDAPVSYQNDASMYEPMFE
jgi:hypothetical protein